MDLTLEKQYDLRDQKSKVELTKIIHKVR